MEEDVPLIELKEVSFKNSNPDPAWMADTFCERVAELLGGIAKGAPRGFYNCHKDVQRISGFDPAFSTHWAANAAHDDLRIVVRAGAEAVAAILLEDAPTGTQFYVPEYAFGCESQALSVKKNIPVRYIRYYDLYRNLISTRFDVYYD